MALPLPDFLALYVKAQEKERDDRLFAQWVVQLPLMATEEQYTSFEVYRDRMTGANIDTRPAEVIIAEIEAAAERAKRKKEQEETEKDGA